MSEFCSRYTKAAFTRSGMCSAQRDIAAAIVVRNKVVIREEFEVNISSQSCELALRCLEAESAHFSEPN